MTAPIAASQDPAAPEPVVIDRGEPLSRPPPLEAFFQAKQTEDEFAFAYTFDDDEDDDVDDDASASSGGSDASSSYASARSQQTTAEPVRDGASVKFYPDPVVEVRLRPVTSVDERTALYYGPDDFRTFRREFRTLLKARRAAIRAQRMQQQHTSLSQGAADDFHWNPLSSIVGAIASAAWNAVPEVIVRAESVSRQQAGLCETGSGGAVIPDRLLHHHGF